jgi:hypothetical protein
VYFGPVAFKKYHDRYQHISDGVSNASEGYVFRPFPFILVHVVLAERRTNIIARFLYNFAL